MYNIKFRIIFKTYIHMQSPSCSTLVLILILETRKENPNHNFRNPRKELKSFVKPRKDIECCLQRW